MPRSGPRSVDLTPYQAQLVAWMNARVPFRQICELLFEEHGLQISSSTLHRQCTALGLRAGEPTERTNALNARITQIFHELRLSDDETVEILRLDGYDISHRRLGEMRRELGLYKKTPEALQEEIEEYARQMVTHELAQGNAEDLGRKAMYGYMRSKYNMVGRDRIYQLVKELNPAGVQQRLKRATRHRGALITPGPNYTWSMDAFCKLEHWGIQVYAAIDVYSRHIMWIYVGSSGRTQVSVGAQYLATLKHGGILPKIIRTDRGAETTLAADLHVRLRREAHAGEDDLQFSDCFRYGTSKENSRIEAWWNQQSRASTMRWRDYFIKLSEDGDFNKDSISDRIALKAIYTPIIRHELLGFVELWNKHKIRKQRDRPYLVPGIPYILYYYPELSGGEQSGMQCPEALHAMCEEFGTFNLDQYLPQATVEWCDVALRDSGFLGVIDGGIHNEEDGTRAHALAYHCLRDHLRAHFAAGNESMLGELHANGEEQRWAIDPETQRMFVAAGQPIDNDVPVDDMIGG